MVEDKKEVPAYWLTRIRLLDMNSDPNENIFDLSNRYTIFRTPCSYIRIICDVLTEYADIVDNFNQNHILTAFHHAIYEIRAKKLREISTKYAKHIRYKQDSTQPLNKEHHKKCCFLTQKPAGLYLQTCKGDLFKICDAFYDYIICKNKEATSQLDPAVYKRYLNKCFEVYEHISVYIDQDREARIEKCLKKRPNSNNDTGGDAIGHLVKWGTK